jgi:hypothetical protein
MGEPGRIHDPIGISSSPALDSHFRPLINKSGVETVLKSATLPEYERGLLILNAH